MPHTPQSELKLSSVNTLNSPLSIPNDFWIFFGYSPWKHLAAPKLISSFLLAVELCLSSLHVCPSGRRVEKTVFPVLVIAFGGGNLWAPHPSRRQSQLLQYGIVDQLSALVLQLLASLTTLYSPSSCVHLYTVKGYLSFLFILLPLIYLVFFSSSSLQVYF